jgi:pyrophosphatase PpaX
MKLLGIIFDLDGTLADTLPVCLRAFQETLEYYTARSISLQELYPLFGPSEEGILGKLLPEQAEEAYPRYLISYERNHQVCTQPFKGIEELLNELHRRDLRIAIATGKSSETAAISMRILGLDSQIDRLETGFIDRGDKPELIRRVLEEWSILPGQAAYVGDVKSDLRAAEQAGVLPIGAAWAETSELRAIERKDGWVIFERVQDLTSWVQMLDH